MDAPERFCRNCGREFKVDDRFCPQCGRPVPETAYVPTPEADVPVPTPPPQAQRPSFWDDEQQPAGAGRRPARSNVARLIGGLLAVVVVLVVIGVALEGAPSQGGGGTASDDPGGGSSEGPGEGEHFNEENYGDVVSDPDAYRGASVHVTGQIFDDPERQGDELVFQMFADPANSDWNTVVRTDGTGLSLERDDYVLVEGQVAGELEGENAFGGSVTAVAVDGTFIETLDAVEAVDPTQEEVVGNSTITDQGFSITLEKIEFAENSTRVYVKISNDTGATVDFYTFNAKIVQGSTQVDQETPFDYELEEPQSTISPGVETEGAIVFGPIDPYEPFEISFEWSSQDYDITPRPIVFRNE